MSVQARTYIDFVRAHPAPRQASNRPADRCRDDKQSQLWHSAPALADVAASITTLDEAYKAQQIAKADARTKANVADDAEIQFDSHLRKLAAYVESIADKDETIIASAGMQTKSARTTPSTLSAPEALSAAAGSREGEIDLTWKKVENSRS